jgi:hypothetical protein
MKSLIKECIAELKKADGFVYKTQEGKVIDLNEAAAKGIAVVPINPKDEVLAKLHEAGLDLTDSKFLNDLAELTRLVSGSKEKKASKKRVSLSAEEKGRLIQEFEKSGKSKLAFSKEKGINYQSFNKLVQESKK